MIIIKEIFLFLCIKHAYLYPIVVDEAHFTTVYGEAYVCCRRNVNNEGLLIGVCYFLGEIRLVGDMLTDLEYEAAEANGFQLAEIENVLTKKFLMLEQYRTVICETVRKSKLDFILLATLENFVTVYYVDTRKELAKTSLDPKTMMLVLDVDIKQGVHLQEKIKQCGVKVIYGQKKLVHSGLPDV